MIDNFKLYKAKGRALSFSFLMQALVEPRSRAVWLPLSLDYNPLPPKKCDGKKEKERKERKKGQESRAKEM